MQITLKQNEIERAVRQYIGKLGINPNDKQVSMEFTAGRGERGLVVEINIEEVGDLNDSPVGHVNVSETPRAPRPQNRAASTPVPTQPPAVDEGPQDAASDLSDVIGNDQAAAAPAAAAGKSLFAQD